MGTLRTKDLIKRLEKNHRFALAHTKGSHRTFRSGAIVVVISRGDREELGPPMIKIILKSAHIDPNNF